MQKKSLPVYFAPSCYEPYDGVTAHVLVFSRVVNLLTHGTCVLLIRHLVTTLTPDLLPSQLHSFFFPFPSGLRCPKAGDGATLLY